MRRPRQRGFSLLELLVALFVIVLLTSLASLNVGPGSGGRQLEARLNTLLDTNTFATDEAQMSGRDFGLLLQRVDVDGELRYRYGWRELREEGWRLPESGAALFGDQNLPVDIELVLRMEGRNESDFFSETEPDTAAPQIVFHASGEVTPGEIDVLRREGRELLWRLQWDLIGRGELLPRGRPGEAEDEN
ncbi:MAG: Tfp pilus assembly protein FimT/FimU [Parahaliea sp.]